MIRLARVTKTYHAGKSNAHTAVAQVSCELPDRRITVLQGPSGSGKTTLLSLIGCMTRPTEGRIFFDRKEISSLPERFLAALRQRRCGFVFQNYNLIKGISVVENVLLPALPLGRPYHAMLRRAEDLLDRLEIASLSRTPVQYLSGGEQQRVAIARALINRPDVIIADEPTAHLDAELSGQFLAIARDLRDRGKTVLIASHDPMVCDSDAVDHRITLRDGRIIAGEAGR